MHLYLLIFYITIGILTLTSFVYYATNTLGAIRFSRNHTRDDLGPEDVTICIPVYNEELDIFKECIESVSSQGSKLVVVGDSSYEPYKTIVERHGGTFVHKKIREGQKRAIALGMSYVETPYVLIMDSDTVLPENAVKSMVSHFVEGVGGVGPNISIKATGTPVAYGAEFVERTREVVYRAMSEHGSVMHLDGACVMYRTDIIKPFIVSGDFLDFKIMGHDTQLGEDWLMALHTLRSGYKLIKDYNVKVESYPQKTLKKFVKQSIRWARSEWVRFGMELKTGNARRKGKFYTFELIYTYMLPVIGLAVLLMRAVQFFTFHSNDAVLLDVIKNALLMGYSRNIYVFLGKLALIITNLVGSGMFMVTVAGRIKVERVKTMAFGAVAMGILFMTTIYGLFTFWKQTKWMTR